MPQHPDLLENLRRKGDYLVTQLRPELQAELGPRDLNPASNAAMTVSRRTAVITKSAAMLDLMMIVQRLAQEIGDDPVAVLKNAMIKPEPGSAPQTTTPQTVRVTSRPAAGGGVAIQRVAAAMRPRQL